MSNHDPYSDFVFVILLQSILLRKGNCHSLPKQDAPFILKSIIRCYLRAALQEIIRAKLERTGIPIEYNKRLRDIAHSGPQNVIAHFEKE